MAPSTYESAPATFWGSPVLVGPAVEPSPGYVISASSGRVGLAKGPGCLAEMTVRQGRSPGVRHIAAPGPDTGPPGGLARQHRLRLDVDLHLVRHKDPARLERDVP